VVAALLILSVPGIRQDPQHISAFYLARIDQQLSTQPNGPQASIPSSLSDPIKPFTPPTLGVWVNGLWFLSLVISLTCALLATMPQQWARRYLRVAHPRYSPHMRARIRAFYKLGVEKLHIPWAVEALRALLHISFFLFFAGLSVFLFGVHPTIFKVVTAWIGLCVILYACLTFLPIIRKDCPYFTPLSAPFSSYITGIRNIFSRLHPSQRFPLVPRDPRSKIAEEFAFRLGPDIDYHLLLSTFQSLYEDTDLEKFFEGLSRLCSSEIGKTSSLQQGFINPHEKELSSALIGLINRTLSSDATELVKRRLMVVCTKAVDSTSLIGPWWILRCVLLGDWHQFLSCVEFGLFVQNWKNITHKVTRFYAQCVAVLTISIMRERDERWFQLASLLNASKSLHEYIAHGDSILLANAIFIVRRTVQTYSGSAKRHRGEVLGASSRTLETVCKLDIRGTLPDLQHEFCGLWNQLVDTARTDQCPHDVSVSTMTLKNIRKLYIALHESSSTPPTALYSVTDDRDPVLDNFRSYPRCKIDSHRPSLPVPDLEFDEPPPEEAEDVPPAPTFLGAPQPLTLLPDPSPVTYSR
jgi:hypothetical protein